MVIQGQSFVVEKNRWHYRSVIKGDEYARIEASGGKEIQWNGHRVFGVLAMSRCIGRYCNVLNIKENRKSQQSP